MQNWYILIKNLFLRLKNWFDLIGYDDFTIEAYFRKQGANVGKNNRIMIRSLGESPYLVMIGNHCTITSGVVLLTHDGAGWLFTDELPSLQKFGSIEILDNCFIGINAVILPGVKVGPNSIVGACSVVTKDVPPGMVVAGNPASVVSDIDSYREKILCLWEQQKPLAYLKDLKDGMAYTPKVIQAAKKRDMHHLEEHLSMLFWGNKGGADNRP